MEELCGVLLCCNKHYQEGKEENYEKDWDKKSNDVNTDSFEDFSLRRVWRSLINCNWSTPEDLDSIGKSSLLPVCQAHCHHILECGAGLHCGHVCPRCIRIPEWEVDDPILEGVEITCVIWFTYKLDIWLVVTPFLKKFWKNPLNIIYLVFIIPFYATLAVDSKEEESKDIENMGMVVQTSST